ncbi:glycoside hydrolase family 2 protein [Nocardioides ferulae]|uniref:glycoside hydrolase family 2 protein n=1 Tax=Nocardioides ferulae TaxID=2340821 RepID=UPI001F0CD7F9|nr:glycoside hydrolase family 2 TIM barrel-domain containing protein [Nocardioides ferulae]
MLTRWGRALDPDATLPEHPRPQLFRERWLNLNGRWSYAIVAGRLDDPTPATWDGEIVVPFSPEAPLSGVGRALRPGETIWYHRTVSLPAPLRAAAGERVLLHLGAVDQVCRVLAGPDTDRLDEVGRHEGGYLPVRCEVTDAVAPDGSLTVVVAVEDETDAGPRSRGKQRTRRGGIWYTPQSGIWQTVWLETVPETYVERLVLTPDLAAGELEVTVHLDGPAPVPAEVEVRAGERVTGRAEVVTGTPTRVALDEIRPWHPDDPFLYEVTVRAGADRVTGQVGMRSFGVGPGADGRPRLLLNGEPFLQVGVLDQGYWPDGLYTPPADAAMVHDIAEMKRLGFTMLRKHIKVEPLRWYHHCDRLGMLVWQDAVNGGAAYRPGVVTAPAVAPFVRLRDTGARGHRRFGRADSAGRAAYERELRELVEHLRSATSLAVWVPFNEGWGQFDAARIAGEVAALDPTRPVDHASGWHDQGAGDLRSLHVYFRPFRVPRAVRRRREPRVLALTEYGGYALAVPGHTWGEKSFGYRRMRDAGALAEAFLRLHRRRLAPAVRQGLAATVYTQLSDVEDEINGLLTYDREVTKLPAEVVRAAVAALADAAP